MTMDKGFNLFGADDIGHPGWWTPKVLTGHPMNELRNIAGPPPSPNKRWVMVDLMSGEVKWYFSQKRTYTRRRRRK